MSTFLVFLVVILITTRLFGMLANKLHQPSVVGEMVAGIFLGPTILGFYFPSITESFSNGDLINTFYYISQIGLGFYMFLLGTELDEKHLKNDQVKIGSSLALSGIIFVFILGFFASYLLYVNYDLSNIGRLNFSLFVASALSLTAFPMLAKILEEYDLLQTSLAKITLLAASLDDLVAWLLLALMISIIDAQSIIGFFKVFALTITFLLFMFKVIKPLLKKLSERELSTITFSIVIIVTLTSMLITNYIGVHSIFGGFIAGLITPRKIVNYIVPQIRNTVSYVLLPTFFVYSGLTTNLNVIFSTALFPVLIYLVVSIIGKYGAVTISAKLNGFSWSDSSAIGALMNSRGLMILIFGNVGLTNNIINTYTYSIFVIIALVTTIMTYPLFKTSYYGLKMNKLNHNL